MIKLRLMMLGILAALAVGAVAASTASAAFTLSEEKCGAGKVSICWDSTEKGTNLRELIGEESFSVTQLGEGLLETTFNKGAVKVHIVCTETSVEGGVILAAAPLTTETTIDIKSLLFKGCTLLELEPKCKVSAEISTKPLVGKTTAVSEVTFTPEAGELFVEVQFTGEECLLKGKQPITGKEVCNWLEPEVDLKGHTLECKHTTKGLLFAKETATLETKIDVTIPTLEATDFWDIALA